MQQRIETLILKNLIHNDEYARKVLPFLNKSYFEEHRDKLLYEHIDEFINKYNNLPTKEALVIELENSTLNDSEFDSVTELLTYVENQNTDDTPDIQWLLETTERFCQDKAIYNAVVKSIKILDEPEKTQDDKGAIPELLTNALSVSFDPHIGHDYFLDSDDRYLFYHRVEKKIPFDLEFFNKITQGGLSTKTLNIALAGTGVGKSLFMCHQASSCLSQGHDVLYITLEMSEERIAERIDANLLNIKLDDLKSLPKSMYDKKMGDFHMNQNVLSQLGFISLVVFSVFHFESAAGQQQRNFDDIEIVPHRVAGNIYYLEGSGGNIGREHHSGAEQPFPQERHLAFAGCVKPFTALAAEERRPERHYVRLQNRWFRNRKLKKTQTQLVARQKGVRHEITHRAVARHAEKNRHLLEGYFVTVDPYSADPVFAPHFQRFFRTAY